MNDEDKTREQLIDELVQLRKKMEEELRTQKEKLSTIFNASPSGMVLLSTPDYKYLKANDSFEKIMEFRKDEAIGYTGFELNILDSNQWDSLVNALHENNTLHNLELNVKTKSKKVLIILASFWKIYLDGQECILVVFDDITKRKVLEQELINSNELFKKAFDFSPFPMVITSDDDNKLIEVNKTFLETFGCNREEVIGNTALNLKFFSNPEQCYKLIEELHHNGYFKNVEVGFQTKSGHIIGLVSASLINFEGKLCSLGIVNDITELKQAELERQIFQKEIARLDYLNLVGQMASGIGHEIRNPMTSVRGFLQLLANKETNNKNKEYFDLMIDELDRANSIITEYLSLAKDRIVELRPTSLNAIIIMLYPLLKSDALRQDKRILLNIGDVPDIPLSEKEIRQLIVNLVRNAIEASPQSGVITLSTYVSNGELVLAVEDEGKGIPAEIIDKLGTPFLTTKENGTGLGVSVCYSIAYKHNAKIDIKTGSTGTTFYVRFKMSSNPIEQVS